MSRNKNRPTDLTGSVASEIAYALLREKGIDHRQFSNTVAEALGMSYPGAHAKMKSVSAWLLEELQKLAQHLNVPLLLGMRPLVEREGEPAALLADGALLPCQVVLGDVVNWPFGDDFKDRWVAVSLMNSWLVVPASGVKLPARRVRMLVMTDFEGVDAPGFPLLNDESGKATAVEALPDERTMSPNQQPPEPRPEEPASNDGKAGTNDVQKLN